MVIPVYNSEETIENVVYRIKNTFDTLKELFEFEVILVNDCSKDKSLQVCKEICEKMKNVKLISFAKNFGQHHAVIAGFRFVTGEYIICLDDDLQIPPEEIPKLIEKLEEKDYDVVFAKYKFKKHSKYRNLGSMINDAMANYLIKKPKHVTMNSFFIAKRFVINEIIKYDNPYPYIGGLLFRVTQNIGSVLVKHRERIEGTSNYNFKKLLSLWLNGFTSFSIKPLRISSLAGMIISALSFLWIVFIVTKKLLFPNIQLGWTSLMVGISFIGGVQLMGIGLLGEYVGRIYLSINKTPQYVVKEMYNISGNEYDENYK